MRSIVTILSFILLCIQLSAQEKIEALKLISDICEKNISIDDFKKQYSDYFIINHDTDSTDSGLFMEHTLACCIWDGWPENRQPRFQDWLL